MVGMPPAWRMRSVTAWIVVPLSQTSSTTSTRWPRRSGSAGNWRNVGCGPGWPSLVVVLDRRDEDVPDAQAVGEHPGRHEAAPRDREQQVEFVTDQALGEARHEPVHLVPADDVARRRGGGHGHHAQDTRRQRATGSRSPRA